MKIVFLTLALFCLEARAEKIQLGHYSGRPGHFAKIGTEFQTSVDAVFMNADVEKSLNKYKFDQLGLSQTKECDVDGMYQSIGYTIFKIKTCK